MLVPINITGGSYTHKSRSLSAQVTRNLVPQLTTDDIAVKSKYILDSWVGKTLLGSTAEKGRGIFQHKGVLYRVAGVGLYRVSSSGTHSYIGQVDGSFRCIFAGIGDGFVITTNGRAFHYDGSSLSEITDINLENPNTCTHLNNQIIYDGIGGRFAVSDVGDPTTINGLNYATAESSSDDLSRVYAFDQVLYMFGKETIETWWNSGSGNPPFDRVEGGIIQKGLGAIHSVSNDDSNIYFLGDDGIVYAMKGSTVQSISTIAMSSQIDKYDDFSDAIGWSMTLRGINYYVLTFPSNDKTWVYPGGGQWFEWSSGVIGGRDISNSYSYVYNKHVAEDYSNGNLYELDFESYSDNGSPIVKVRDTGHIHGGMLNNKNGSYDGKTLTMNRFELLMEVGTGSVTGQGYDPEIMLSFSDDGGKTFSTEQRGCIGRDGAFLHVVTWSCLGSFVNRVIRIAVSDPVYISIHSATAELEVGI